MKDKLVEKCLLAREWADPKLAQFQQVMSCGYKHYDPKIIKEG